MNEQLELNFKREDFMNRYYTEHAVPLSFTLAVRCIPDPKGGVCVDQRYGALVTVDLCNDIWDDAHLTDSEKLLWEALANSILDRQYK